MCRTCVAGSWTSPAYGSTGTFRTDEHLTRISPGFSAQNFLIQKESSIKEQKRDCVNTRQPCRRVLSSSSDGFCQEGAWNGRYNHSLPRSRQYNGGACRGTQFMWNLDKFQDSVPRFLYADHLLRNPPPPYPGELGTRKANHMLLGNMASGADFGQTPIYTSAPPYSSKSRGTTTMTPPRLMRTRLGDTPHTFQTKQHSSGSKLLLTDLQICSVEPHPASEWIETSYHQNPRKRSGGTAFCLVSCVEDPANNQEQPALKDRVTSGEYIEQERAVTDQLTTKNSEEHQNQANWCSNFYRKVQDVKCKTVKDLIRGADRTRDKDFTETVLVWKELKKKRPSEMAQDKQEHPQGYQTKHQQDHQQEHQAPSEEYHEQKGHQRTNKSLVIIDATSAVVKAWWVNSHLTDMSGCDSDSEVCPEQKISQMKSEDLIYQGSPQGSCSKSGPTSGDIWYSTYKTERIPRQLRVREEELKIKKNSQEDLMVPDELDHVNHKTSFNVQVLTEFEMSKELYSRIEAEDDSNYTDARVLTGAPKQDSKDHPDLVSSVRSHPRISRGLTHQESSELRNNILQDEILIPCPNLSGDESSEPEIVLQNRNISYKRHQVSHLIQLFSRHHVQTPNKILAEENPTNATNINNPHLKLPGDLLGTREDGELVGMCDVLVAPLNTLNKTILQKHPQDASMIEEQNEANNLHTYLHGDKSTKKRDGDEISDHQTDVCLSFSKEFFNQKCDDLQFKSSDMMEEISDKSSEYTSEKEKSLVRNSVKKMSVGNNMMSAEGEDFMARNRSGETNIIMSPACTVPHTDLSLHENDPSVNVQGEQGDPYLWQNRSSDSHGASPSSIKSSQSLCQTNDKYSQVSTSSLPHNHTQCLPQPLWDAVNRIRKYTAPDSDDEDEESFQPLTLRITGRGNEIAGCNNDILSQNVCVSSVVEEDSDDTLSSSSQDSINTVIHSERGSSDSNMNVEAERHEKAELFTQKRKNKQNF